MDSSNAIESETGRAGGLRIIVVDDSVAVRGRLVDSLIILRGVASVIEAGDVPAGLLLIDEHRPDVVVVDIEIPGKSGLDLLGIVRGTHRQATIIMFSIHDHPQLRRKCRDLGANFYFNKLTEFDRVAEVCRDLAEQQSGKSPRPSPDGTGETPT